MKLFHPLQNTKTNGLQKYFEEWQQQREMKVPILGPGGLFKDYELHKVNPVSSEMEDMDAITLNYWLTKFVMEVAKDSGERYPPTIVISTL